MKLTLVALKLVQGRLIEEASAAAAFVFGGRSCPRSLIGRTALVFVSSWVAAAGGANGGGSGVA